ncbi:MAG TPA: hypothetical protein VFF77_07570 [Holophagaceae bacterium]|jgi:hypothetical protein|nr:hypothetical protein [Holophagaceae bacterium]
MTDPMNAHAQAADTALSLLFRKLHPHLEDAAHALAKGVAAPELERLHGKLLRARVTAVAALDAEAVKLPEGDDLRESLEALAADLAPFGETWKESLTLTQLCLEEAPAELLPHLPDEVAEAPKWAPRLASFFEKLEDPAYHAEQRWRGVDEEIGDQDAEAED